MTGRPFRFLFLLILLVFGLLRSGALSCGGASPPAGIPAPVSNLMSVGNPDGSGTVTVTGAPGSVNPGAMVSGSNTSGVASSFSRLWMNAAWAENQSFSASTIADTDGSFRLRLNASIGNILRLTQALGTDTSLPTELPVTGRVVTLGVNPQGLGVDTVTHLVYVTASEDSEGLVFSLPLNSANPASALSSSPPPAFSLNELEGIGDVGVDEELGKVFSVSAMDNSLVRFPLATEMSLSDQTLSSPLVIDVLNQSNLAVIGLADSTASLVLFDTASEKFSCSFLIPSPSGVLSHVATPLLQVIQNEKGVTEFFAVSQYQDGSWALSRITFSGCSIGFALTAQVALPASVEPKGLAVFNSGANALITDGAGNQVLVADFNAGTWTAAVPVGKSPTGIAINTVSDRAYVVNSGDNSVTSIHLSDLSTATQTSIGLSPTDISVDPDLNIGVVLSPFDQSAVIVDLTF